MFGGGGAKVYISSNLPLQFFFLHIIYPGGGAMAPADHNIAPPQLTRLECARQQQSQGAAVMAKRLL